MSTDGLDSAVSVEVAKRALDKMNNYPFCCFLGGPEVVGDNQVGCFFSVHPKLILGSMTGAEEAGKIILTPNVASKFCTTSNAWQG